MKRLPFKIAILSLFILIGNGITANAQVQDANLTNKLPVFNSKGSSWVDSVYNSLTLEQRIGQLFMVAAYSGTSKYNENVIQNLIRSHHIGGLIFMQGTAKKQAELTNKFQRLSKVPLLIGMDAEWGLGMRLKGIKDLPKQMYLGAANDKELMYKYGQFVAAQCNRLGVHVNFAPVIDVNNNPKNPVINFRSFGEDKKLVSKLGVEYMRGLQKNGVMACAKHFPGHGDTDVDSHKDLPEIKKSLNALKDVEFYPFRELFANGIQSVMIAHLNIPSLEPQKNLPTTLSKNVVTDLLRGDMKFGGLIFTDALNMKGVTKYYKPGEVDYLAFKAGNDVLLFSENVAIGVSKITAAVKNGKINEDRIESSVKRILMAKYKAGLNEINNIETANIDKDINDLTHFLRQETAKEGITLLSDPYNVLDKVRKQKSNKTAYVFVGTSSHPNFMSDLRQAKIDDIFFARASSPKAIKSLQEKLKSYDAVIVGVHNMGLYPSNNYGLDQGEINAIKTFAKNRNTLNVVFGNPYAINKMETDAGYLVCYDEHDESLETALKILTSEISAKGKLPVSVTNKYQYQAGIASTTNNLGQEVVVIDKNDAFAKRWKAKNNTTTSNGNGKVVTCCVSPEAIGANINYLNKVDALIKSAINQGASPGCRVMAIKDGKVFYDRNFGYNSYTKKVHVENTTLYDLASVTKIAATNIAVMKLYEQGKIKLDGTLGQYLPWTRKSNKRNVKIKDLLLHQGGLHAWIPFYKETLDSKGYPKKSIYQTRPSGQYNIQVCNGLYMKKQWVDTMWKRILDSKLTNLGRYKYSDLDFIFLQKVVEKVSGMPLDKYVAENFYKPLGMNQTFFNPKRQTVQGAIAPSEYDGYFRHKKVQGYVHDMGAAMFGGVSGHAGLFSTAKDMSILMQMLLNGGSYDGKQYLKPSTIKLFSAKNSFLSRRGLGFDKPQPNKKKSQPTSPNCSLQTFGHTGFTGTCLWADPKHNIQFIFLSNRTYPSADNWKINRLDVREKAQEYIYKSFGIINR